MQLHPQSLCGAHLCELLLGPSKAVSHRMEMITPKDYVGALIQLSESRRGEFVDMQFLTEARTTLTYNIPLAEVTQPMRRSWFAGPCSGVCLRSIRMGF